MKYNVLIIGNGFDLVHGLPTSYIDFLKFIKVVVDYYINNGLDDIPIGYSDFGKDWINLDVDEGVYNELRKEDSPLRKRFAKYFINNFWINYFEQLTPNLGKERIWIDFEKEFSNVNNYLTSDVKDDKLDEILCNTQMMLEKRTGSEFKDESLSRKQLNNVFQNSAGITFKEYYYNTKNNDLENDSERLNKLFVLYLRDIVEKIKVDPVRIVGLYPDSRNYFISFNYTNTLERVYGINKLNIEYIHGKVKPNTNDENTVVMGYLDIPSNKNGSGNITYGGKATQRILNDTQGININKIKNSDIIIFGHSLGEMDRDILELIFDNGEKIVIYCKDKEDKKEKIVRLRDIIGEEKYKKLSLVNNKKYKFETTKLLRKI